MKIFGRKQCNDVGGVNFIKKGISMASTLSQR